MIVDGSARREKYPTKVDTVNRNKKSETRRKILVIKDESQRPKGKIYGVLIDVSGLKTIIKFSNRKFIDPAFSILKREQGKFPWKKNHRQSEITIRIKLEDPEIKELENLIRRTIKL